MVSKIQQGKDVQKVSSSWRLATRLEKFQQWLRSNNVISFKHIRREGNKLADFLANLGINRGEEFFAGSWQETASESETNTFKNIISSDMQNKDEDHPDAGVQKESHQDHRLPCGRGQRAAVSIRGRAQSYLVHSLRAAGEWRPLIAIQCCIYCKEWAEVIYWWRW